MGTGGTRRNFTAADGVSLKEYFDTRLSAMERAMNLTVQALERRLDGLNGAGRLITRDELTALLRPICDQIAELKTYKDQAVGKASQASVTTATGLAVVGLVISLVSLVSKLW